MAIIVLYVLGYFDRNEQNSYADLNHWTRYIAKLHSAANSVILCCLATAIYYIVCYCCLDYDL